MSDPANEGHRTWQAVRKVTGQLLRNSTHSMETMGDPLAEEDDEAGLVMASEAKPAIPNCPPVSLSGGLIFDDFRLYVI